MAKINDLSLTWFGDQVGRKQMLLAVPGMYESDKGGMVFLEAISSGTANGGVYLFTDGTNLRYATTKPTNTNTGGSVLDSTTVSGMANSNLTNLGTTAINADMNPTSTNTKDLGHASYVWAEGFVTKLVLYPTDCYFTGTSAVATLTGSLLVGANTGAAAYDVKFHGYTAGQWMFWDENYNSNAGGLLLGDSVMLAFGAGYDVSFSSDGTNLLIGARADDVIVKSGYSQHVDWIWYSKNSTNDACWTADVSVFQLSGTARLHLGGAAALDEGADGFKLAFDDADTLNIDPINADDVVRIGETTLADFYLDGASTDMVWDNSQNELVLHDNTKLVFGGAGVAGTDDLIISSGGTTTIFQFGATTNSMIMRAYAAQTTAVMDFDGDTAAWSGANDVGLLHIRSDSALANAGASLFYIDNSGTPKANSEGFMARIVDTSSNATGTFAVQMVSSANHVMEMQTLAVGVTPLTISPHTNATASALSVDAGTDGFVGAANTGLVNISAKGTLAQTTASCLRIDSNGAYAANGEGGCLFIDDDMTASSTNYSVYVNSNAVNCMKLETANTGMTALTLEPVASATVPAFIIDGDANGWSGANEIGLAHIMNDTQMAHADASLVFIDNTGAAAASATGSCLRVIDTGTAATAGTAYVAYIASTNNEALHVDSGTVVIDESLSVGTTLTQTGAATFTAGQQSASVALPATAGGAAITAGSRFITVSSTGANSIVILPAPTVGNIIDIFESGTGYELRSSAPDTIAINGGTGTATDAESAIAADLLVTATCTAATTWVVSALTATGADSAIAAAAT